MIKDIVIVGTRGAVGSKLIKIAKNRKFNVFPISAQKICDTPCEKLPSFIEENLKIHSGKQKDKKLGLILAHRIREEDIRVAMSRELSITRDFPIYLKNYCEELRIIMIGSVTGRLVNAHNEESYHYCKELQKAVNRYFVFEDKIKSNLLELSLFQKYGTDEADNNYNNSLIQERKKLGGRSVVDMFAITDFCISILETKSPPISSVITYDGGYSLRQT